MEILGICRYEPDNLIKNRGKLNGKYSRFYFCCKEGTLKIRVYHDQYLKSYTEYNENEFDRIFIIVKQPFISYRDYFLERYKEGVRSEDKYNHIGKVFHFSIRRGARKEEIKIKNLPRQQALKMLTTDYKGYKIYERFLEKWIPVK